MHEASNKVISKFVTKQKFALEAIISIAGTKPEGTKLQRTETQLQYVYEVNGKHIFSIFVSYPLGAYRIRAYSANGMEQFDFKNIELFQDAVRIIKLIAFKMKADN